MRNAWAVVSLAVYAALAGAATPPGQPKAPQATAPAKKAASKLSDAQIEAAIRAKFAKSKSATSFTVRVQGGVAHIDGKTDVIQRKAAASRMAKTAGAVAVDNKVQVSEAAKARAAGNLEQGRRRAQVKRGEVRDNRK
jgi:BON domain